MNIAQKVIEIAKKHLFIDSFNVKNSDSEDFKHIHVSAIENALEESYLNGLFDIIKKNFIMIAHENFDNSWNLSYINKRDQKVFIKEYPSFKALTDDAAKFDFNFGFNQASKEKA